MILYSAGERLTSLTNFGVTRYDPYVHIRVFTRLQLRFYSAQLKCAQRSSVIIKSLLSILRLDLLVVISLSGVLVLINS